MNNEKFSSTFSPPSYSAEKSPNATAAPNDKSQHMFKSTQWRDLWAAVLFYLHLAGVFVILGLNFRDLVKAWEISGPPPSEGGLSGLGVVFILSGGSLLLGVLLLAGFLALVQKHPESMIKGTFIASIAMLGLMGLSCLFSNEGLGMGIIYIVSALVSVIAYFVWRKRIPFSASILKNVVEVLKLYPSTWNLAVLAVGFDIVITALYIVTCLAIGSKHVISSQPDSVKDGDIACLVYLAFSLFWTSQVAQNVVHTSVAGVYASYYFLHGSGAGIIQPVWSSLKRSLSYSFGSIAFGSLIVAAIQFVRYLVRSMRNERNGGISALVDCFIGIIESLTKYFNYYAYIHIAMYGKPYLQAGKDTWELVKGHGVEAIVNDDLVGTCMNMGVLLIAFICAFACVIAGSLLTGNVGISFVSAVIAFVFVLFIGQTATQTVKTGVSTIFVCLAEDPSAMARTKPELYREITSKYNGIIV